MLRRVSIVNWKMLVRVLGWLLLIEAIFMGFPLLASAIYREPIMPFVTAILITLGVGLFATFCVKPHRYDMGKREGFLLTALVWVVFSLFGTIPFMAVENAATFTDAFFEAMSGFTTTGVSTFADTESLPYGIHLWRSLMQWLGGMGIILFTLAVLPMLNSSGGMQMFNAEVTGITHEKLRPRVSSTAKRLWLVYFLLTVLLFILYVVGPMNCFDSLCHAFSTMSTGGFSTRGEVLEGYNSLYVKIVTTVFMFIGGVNFALIFRASTGHFRSVWHNEVFRLYVAVCLVMFVVIDISLILNPAVEHSVENYTVNPLFQVVSTISSTGYAVSGINSWGAFPLGVLVLMMLVGACAGSTSGGAKLDRVLVLFKNSHNELTRCIYPNRILPVEVNHQIIPTDVINKVLVFIALYVMVIVDGALLLTLCGGSLRDSAFAAFACVSNSGLDSSISPNGGLYTSVSDGGKWILSLMMLTGRLEIFTVLLIFTPRFWKR
ncbi:MAG: TrkH family potassium uptake protein [Bacteroidales bacterium]|nr:TrkH family potassium uptake protein [Bacteroidales bacterium]